MKEIEICQELRQSQKDMDLDGQKIYVLVNLIHRFTPFWFCICWVDMENSCRLPEDC